MPRGHAAPPLVCGIMALTQLLPGSWLHALFPAVPAQAEGQGADLLLVTVGGPHSSAWISSSTAASSLTPDPPSSEVRTITVSPPPHGRHLTPHGSIPTGTCPLLRDCDWAEAGSLAGCASPQ